MLSQPDTGLRKDMGTRNIENASAEGSVIHDWTCSDPPVEADRLYTSSFPYLFRGLFQ